MKVGDNLGHGRLLLASFTLILITPEGLTSYCLLFQRGASAVLTCTYSENIAEIKRDFSVHHYETDLKDSKPDTVVGCSWLIDGLNCKCDAGYSVHGNVSNQVVVKIPEVKKNHDGRYACPVVPTSKDDHISFCTLVYNEALSSPKPVSGLDEPDAENPDGIETETTFITYIVTAVCSTYVLIAALIAILLCRQMKATSQAHPLQESTPTDTETDERSDDAQINATALLGPSDSTKPT